MEAFEGPLAESRAIPEFARIMSQAHLDSNGTALKARPPARLEIDPESVKNGLGQLVLTLVKLLHELLERQAIRRIEAGSLGSEQIEKLGLTLMRQAEEIDRLRREFGLEEEDLNLDLGPLGRVF
jgi:hypothetical protein